MTKIKYAIFIIIIIIIAKALVQPEIASIIANHHQSDLENALNYLVKKLAIYHHLTIQNYLNYMSKSMNLSNLTPEFVKRLINDLNSQLHKSNSDFQLKSNHKYQTVLLEYGLITNTNRLTSIGNKITQRLLPLYYQSHKFTYNAVDIYVGMLSLIIMFLVVFGPVDLINEYSNMSISQGQELNHWALVPGMIIVIIATALVVLEFGKFLNPKQKTYYKALTKSVYLIKYNYHHNE